MQGIIFFQNAQIANKVVREEAYKASNLRIDLTAHVKPAL